MFLNVSILIQTQQTDKAQFGLVDRSPHQTDGALTDCLTVTNNEIPQHHHGWEGRRSRDILSTLTILFIGN